MLEKQRDKDQVRDLVNIFNRIKMRCWKVIERISCELAQNQIIRRQVETSNNAARDAQAFLRTTQEQQKQNIRTVVPLVTIPSSSIHQRGYAQESFMVRDITMLAQSRCVSCMVVRK